MINIDEKIKNSLLNKSEIEVKVYRAIKAEILKFKTQKNAPEYTDAEEIKLINKMIKAHEESIEAYSKADRDELVKNEQSELSILVSLVPKKATSEDVERECQAFIYSLQEVTKKDMGKIIKHLKEVFPTNDGKEISDIVKKYLYI